jgi:hypothetical protein
MDHDVGWHFLKVRANRLDQGQMELEARAIQVPQERHNHSLGSPPPRFGMMNKTLFRAGFIEEVLAQH